MRFFAISDLHVDHPKNRQWMDQLSIQEYQDDILILAGDLTHNSRLLEQSFIQLVNRFYQVLFVPGNHDLWVIRKEGLNSFEKYNSLVSLVEQLGVSMQPWTHDSVTVVPLLGWYDYSFGKPGKELRNRWMDYQACNWAELNNDVSSVTEFFTGKNQRHLDHVNETIISFSHFVPRIDVMPDYIPLKYQTLYPILGSATIEKQIRRLNSTIHVYGHSHVNREVEIQGITYINNAFGTPSETRIAQKGLKCIFEL